MDRQPITSMKEFVNEYKHEYPGSRFFNRDVLRNTHQRLSGMTLLKCYLKVTDIWGKEHTCYVVSSRLISDRWRPRVYHYFDVNTLEHVIRENNRFSYFDQDGNTSDIVN